MTTTEAFDTWYFEQVGITLAEAKQRSVADLALLESCYQAATERAAKLCDEQGDFYMQQAREGDQSGASDHKACAAVECADAIRETL